MSGTLENRSSLRKLDFPACSRETLDRLVSSFSDGMASTKGTPSSAGQLLSPKETELVLEIIDEFVFFTKPSLSKSKRLNPIQELQLMQVIIDFFQTHCPTTFVDPTFDSYFASNDMMVLCNIFNHLFMDPPNSGLKDEDSNCTTRMKSLVRLTSVALGLRSRPVLYCVGVWLHRQGPTSAKGTLLCESLLRDFVLLVQEPLDALKSVPVIGPLFSAHFMTSVTELYPLEVPTSSSTGKYYSSNSVVNQGKGSSFPPQIVVEVFVCWLGESSDHAVPDSENRMLPSMSPVLNSASRLLAQTHPAIPLVGLAKWTILHPLVAGKDSKLEGETLAKLHVGILECLAETNRRRHLVRNDVVPAKKVVHLFSDVQVAIDNVEHQEAIEVHECLDRLGQFLNCLVATELVFGTLDGIVSGVRNLPENRLLKILLENLSSGV